MYDPKYTDYIDGPTLTLNLVNHLGDRPLAGFIHSMFDSTRGVVGGSITRLETNFEDGAALKGVKLINEEDIVLPVCYKDKINICLV